MMCLIWSTISTLLATQTLANDGALTHDKNTKNTWKLSIDIKEKEVTLENRNIYVTYWMIIHE
jgi:hypothetical protein